jgi:hypothetical protein
MVFRKRAIFVALVFSSRHFGISDEANISTKQSETAQQAWLPCAHGHEERPEGPCPPPRKGPLEAFRQ